MEYFLSVMNGFSLVNERFLITGECFLSVIEGFFPQWLRNFPSVVEIILSVTERFLIGDEWGCSSAA